jgi:hypothetical protein|tara:strand:+ start:21007 stop:21141 length:135 start_codon:yes stop_codon:yes gene_type:complete
MSLIDEVLRKKLPEVAEAYNANFQLYFMFPHPLLVLAVKRLRRV